MKLPTKLTPFLFALIASIVCLYGCSSSGVSPEYRTYESLLKNQMQDMTNVINAGHYNEFLSTYVDPAYLSKEGGVDQVLLQFDNKQQQQLYKDLKIARNVTPLYNDKSKTMIYMNETLSRPIAFKLIGGKWMMEGDWFR